MRYALVIDGVVTEIIKIKGDIKELYHPDFVKMLVECDDDTQVGFSYIDGVFYEPLLVKNTASLDDYVAAIDSHIIQMIKTLDYDDIAEVALAAIHGEFQVEALRINEWIHLCWDIQSKIKSGDISFDTVDDALLALPQFIV